MDFEKFYNLVSDTEKLKYLFDLLKAKSDLQRDFKEKTNCNNLENLDKKEAGKCDEFKTDIHFEDLVAKYTEKFEEDFSEIDFSDVDWEDIDFPHDHYVEEWEVVESYFSDQIADLFIPVKDLLLDKIVSGKFTEVLAACCALFDACQNIEIKDGDYCDSDGIRSDFFGNFIEIIQYTEEQIRRFSTRNKSLDEAVIKFFEYFFSKYENDPYFEKDIEGFVYSLVSKSENAENVFKLFEKKNKNFKYFPKISSYLLEKYSNAEQWMNFAIKSYFKDVSIAEKLLLTLHKSDTEKFIAIAFTLTKNTANYYQENTNNSLDYHFVNNCNVFWNNFLYPLLNSVEHKPLYVSVNLNLAKNTSDLKYYDNVRSFLNEKQKQEYIDSISYESFKVSVYIVENEIDKAKAILSKNDSLSELLGLIKPFVKSESEYCFNFVTSFIDKKIKTLRGRTVYAEIANLLTFTKNLNSYQQKTDEFVKKICTENNKLSALKDELKNAKLL
jgi:hypothetical protein